MYAIDTPNSNRFFAFISLAVVILVAAGCDGRNTVDAVARNSNHKPVFGTGEAVSKTDPLTAATDPMASPFVGDLSFLHRDHFGCIRIRPASILGSPALKQIPWADLELQLAKVVGDANCKLNNIDAIWLLLDQSFLETINSASKGDAPPFVTVLDFNTKIDRSSLKNATDAYQTRRDRTVENENQTNSDHSNWIVVEAIDDERIVIGTRKAIEKLKANSRAPELAALISSWDKDADAEAALVVSPIRPMLQGWFDMLARFGGDAKKFAQLPDVVDNIRLTLNLSGDSKDQALVVGRIKIEDEQLAKDLVKTISAVISSSGSTGMATMMGAGFEPPDASANLMFAPSSADSVSRFIQEIGDQDLFSVRNPAGEIVLRLDRPDSLENVILAVVKDGKKQLEIMERTERLGKIATALKAYEDEYQCLPSLDAISEDQSRTLKLPAQFSWRVALLPFLGKQELYDRFDFAKPWDAPENIAIAEDMPTEFMSSEDKKKTSFQLATGENSLFRIDRPRPKLSDLSDRKIWTAVVVDAKTEPEHSWTDPRGPSFDSIDAADFGRDDELGVMFINASFQVRIVKRDDERLLKIMTNDGNEKMTSKDFIQQK